MSRLFLLVGVLCLSACVASRAPSRANAEVITREQIEHADAATALDAIQRLRPSFLRYRGNATTSSPRGVAPVVYFGEDRLGSLTELGSIDIVHVEEIRYISAIDATTRWGTGHTGGVILIVTRKSQ
ncbi:MAG: hypothetical protein M3081_07500 [Gemmatimonadota bacterium]|nr:hypothetical protein [Gemmatimonadota bacterium]